MKRMLAGLFFCFILLYNGCAGAESARSAVLIEAQTGRVLYAYNAHEPLPMASTTKIMTALLALEQGALADRVTVGPNAYGVPGTSIYLEQGEQLTLEEMLYGLMLASGNDAAVAIAEHIGGTAEEFCRMMTARAAEIGCENTVFTTPHGLPDPGHHTTAWDLALIALEAMKNPVFREIVATQRASLPWAGREYGRVLTNKNRLLTEYPGAMGVKTGYTRAAGRCLVFAAERRGLRLIGAVLNCPDWFSRAEAILDEGFRDWRMATLYAAGETVRTVPVTGGAVDAVAAVAERDVSAPVRADAWPDLMIELPEALPPGVPAGQRIGTAILRDGNEIVAEVPLLAARDTGKSAFRHRMERILALWAAGE